MGGRWQLDRDKERERFTRWAKKLGIDFDPKAFDDLVDFHGLGDVVKDLEASFLKAQSEAS